MLEARDMRAAIRVGALMLALGLCAQPLLAQERVIGLLELPEVFGQGSCDPFTPKPVTLRASPGGPVVATVLVTTPMTVQADGGCGGLEVGVRAARTSAIEALPSMEFAYESPAAIVLEQRGTWFRIRLKTGSAWLEASRQREFYDLEALLTDSLAHFEAWNGSLASAPNGEARRVALPGPAAEQGVQVLRAVRVKGELWFLVELLSHNICTGSGTPKAVDRGWVPAYTDSNETTLWFYSRGC
jgi:hypothetical protein